MNDCLFTFLDNHRHRVGRFWRQRCNRLHKDRLRQTSRQQLLDQKFLHVSLDLNSTKFLL